MNASILAGPEACEVAFSPVGSVTSEFGLQPPPNCQIPKLAKSDKLFYYTLAFSAEVIA